MPDIAFNSFGAIREIEVAGTYTVDTGHIVPLSGIPRNVAQLDRYRWSIRQRMLRHSDM